MSGPVEFRDGSWATALACALPEPVAHLTRLLCVLLRDPLGGDWIAGRIGLLDRFIDQLLLALVQILAGDPITGRILGSQIRVNLPRVTLLLVNRRPIGTRARRPKGTHLRPC